MEIRTRATPMLAVLFLGVGFVNDARCQESRGESRPATKAESRPAPMFSIRIGKTDEWIGNDRDAKAMSPMLDLILSKVVPPDFDAAEFKKGLGQLKFPCSMDFYIDFDASTIDVDVRIPSENERVVKSLLELAKVDMRSEAIPSLKEIDGRSWNFGEPNPHGVMLLTARRGGETQIWVRVHELVEEVSIPAIGEFFAPAPPAGRVESQVTARGVRCAVRTQELFRKLKEESPIAASAFAAFVGPWCDGFAYTTFSEGGRGVVDAFLDVRPGVGAFGKLFEATSSSPGVSGWIPTDAQRFAYGRIASKNLPAIAKLLRPLQIPLDPVKWGESFEWLADAMGTHDLYDVLAKYWTGDFAYVTTPFVRPASVKADAHHDFVLIFGDERPLELLDWLRRVPGNYEDLDIRTAPAGDLQGFIDLAIDGSVLFRIGSAPGVLIVAGTGTASSQLLRTVLATEGKTKEHSVLAKFLGKAELAKPRVLTYVAHTLSMLRMQQDMNASIGVPADPMLDAYFDAIAPLYDGEAGLTAGTVSVVSDGVRIRSYSTRAR